MILNGLPWKRTEIFLSFLRLHPSTALQTLVDHDGYMVAIVDIMARGSSREDQPHVQGAVAAWAQEGLEELSHVEGQEGWQ